MPIRTPLSCHITRLGLKIAIADVQQEQLQKVGKEIASIIGEQNVLVVPTDVSKLNEVEALHDKVYENWGEVSIFEEDYISMNSWPSLA